MLIQVTGGTGAGPTKMAAFDAALNQAGTANYNLIKLSSIIPPDSKVKSVSKIKRQPGSWGDRLYVVMAEVRVDTPNVEAWAGIGWVQEAKTGKGLFVEHEGANRHTVELDIQQSLKAMMDTRKVNFGTIKMKVVGQTCTKEPVCALAIAVYQASSWLAEPGFEDS
jgi:arginine decarboxylase